MDWISKLERKFGRYAISSVMKYIIIFQVIGFFLLYMGDNIFAQYFALDASKILDGQIWRMATFIMEPPSTSPIFVIFAFYLYYMIGESLEAAWGAFRFNLYLFGGIIFHIIAAFLTYFVTGFSLPLGTTYLNLSLFFAFAALYPNVKFLLFFVIPIKVKYLAWFNAAFFAITVVQGFAFTSDSYIYELYELSNAICALVSVLNFLLFYFTSRTFKSHSPKQMARRKKFKKEMKKATRPEVVYSNGAKHKCTTCGKTELDDPNLEFRYCSKCKGNHEYCQEHLFTHEHIK